MDDWFGGVPYGYTRFPIELFYMDLDGNWLDSDFDGAYDEHLAGLGDLQPEIWVGRILTSTLTLPGETEVTMIKNYFDKNHDYRMGNLPLTDRALVYVDDDWAAWGPEYSNDVGNRYAVRTLIDENEITRSADYLGRLNDNYDWISLFAHSWEGAHGFYYNSGSNFEYLYNEEISSADPVAHFYNHFCCSAGNYSNSDSGGYISGHYVFAPTYGLGAIASTKTGSMLNFADFYIPLGTGESIGQSFLDWFILNGETGAGGDSRAWFYGMTVIGDPTLDTYDDGPPVLPDVTVLEPNTPVTWPAGSSQDIIWNAIPGNLPLDPNPITISYSYDDPEGDGPWTQIATGEANDGTYTWNPVPNTPSTDCWVKVDAVDTGGKVGSDVSDAAFEILFSPPTVSVDSPNGGESLMGGGTWLISWTATAGGSPFLPNPITIEYSTTGAAGPWLPLASNEVNDGTYNWNPVPMLDVINCYLRITVEDTGGYIAEDVSDAAFIIDSTAPLPATAPFAELEGTGVRIYWTASPSSDVEHYQVHWSISFDPTGSSYSSYFDAGLNTNVLHGGVGISAPNGYCYQIRTYDNAGHVTITQIQAAKFGSTESIIANPSGWFLLGSPLVQSDTFLGHVLQGLNFPTTWDCIRKYDGLTDSWSTQVKNSPMNVINDIYTDEGFWLHLTLNSRYATAGYIEDKSISLSDGWNLVAYPFAQRFMNTAAIETHLTSNCPGYAEMLIADHTQPYQLISPSGSENIFQNFAFWIRVTGDTTWTVLNY
jgi:hypothetical protein